MQLIIVESPTKARKLSGYLGSGYQVLASVGHVRDLPKTEMGVDTEANFEPKYVISEGKKKVLAQLRVQAAKADTIILATDPDREGEAIAWHVQEILQASLKKATKPLFQRASFYEITKSAVLAAIKNPVSVNMDLVHAQQARRIVDRLVGYEVSPVLWRKIRRGLSAGRVQSVALRLIVEREKAITVFKPEEYWEVDVTLAVAGGQPHMTARVTAINGIPYAPTQASDTTALVAAIPTGRYQVSELEKKARKTSSYPPFSTSTLQQAAANRLGWSSKQTMRIAQQLYEEGLITYHRTDSFNLSTQALTMARTYISENFAPEYLPSQPRVFRSKSKNAQEAHEAIRVTDAHKTPQALTELGRVTEQHSKLYDLIWRRFLASQMSEAVYDQTSVTIRLTPKKSVNSTEATLKTTGSILTFAGWRTLLPAGDDIPLPNLSEGAVLQYQTHTAAQKFTQPPARYNDASLVKELEKRGIGRPSTYASIISVIVDRRYVERVTKRFFVTPIGMTVADFLQQHFPVFMEYEFTAEMEEDLDRIARGEKAWRTVVGTFYTPFHQRITEVTDSAERVAIPVEKTGEACPECGATKQGEIVIRSGKFGKFKSCSRFPECKFTQNIVEKLEGVICPLCQMGEVVVKNSRWGKLFFGCSTYPKCDWASWKKPEVGERVTAEEWVIQQAARAERRAKFAKKA